ncbi:hypothetical protein HHI36_011300 [Cryptolaemus montrouzieri]|uniref:Uncharacterized protein n=1 Tax=Cryptolaemus montrouzieri TaxID=559131 RepID=A0ABD2MM65_9CUCU
MEEYLLRELRNYVVGAIRREKAYLKFHVNNKRKDSKRLWSALDKLNIHRNALKNLPKSISVEALNNHYINSVLDTDIDLGLLDHYQSNLKPVIEELCEFVEVNEIEVLKVFGTITSSAAGNDNLSQQLWKIVMPHCLGHLTHIIDYSLTTGVVPKLWKIVHV